MACAMTGTVMLLGCTDSDYDFNETDTTIGIGNGEFVLPASSTDTIQLADVLDLDDTECVRIDDVTKEYIFEQSSKDVEGAKPRIEQIRVSEERSSNEIVPFTFSASAKPHGMRRAAGTYHADGNLNIFNYSGDKPEAVVELYKSEAESKFVLTISFSQDMKTHVPTLDNMLLRFPAYMTLSDVAVDRSHTWVQEGTSRLKFTNVDTGNDIIIEGEIHELDFTAKEPDNTDLGHLEIKNDEVDGDKILLDGKLRVTADFSQTVGSLSNSDFHISSNLALDEFIITGATGLFDPDIDLHDLGNTEINDVPDFLTEENVVIDLHNPRILLNIESDLDIDGYVKGWLRGYKEEAIIDKDGHRAEVEVPEIFIPRRKDEDRNNNAASVTHICICRNAAALTNAADYDEVVEVENLSDLIRTIPDKVTFDAEARADAGTPGHFTFEHEYKVVPAYSVNAPLAFGKDARIIYTDDDDGWNDDIKDIELTDGSYIQFEASIENRVPLYLTFKAEALAIGGGLLGDDKVSVEVDRTIIASSNGKDSERTPVVIKIRQNREGALKELDGLRLTFEGDASQPGQPDVTGITLNSEKHFIIAHDVQIKLLGTVAVNLD